MISLTRSKSLPTTHPNDNPYTGSLSSLKALQVLKATSVPVETALIGELMEKLKEKESDATIAAEIGQLLLREVNSLKLCLAQANSTAAESKTQPDHEFSETDVENDAEEANRSTSLVRNLVNDFEALQQTSSSFIERDGHSPLICRRENLGGFGIRPRPFGKPRKTFLKKNSIRDRAQDEAVRDIGSLENTLEIKDTFHGDPAIFKTYQQPDINADVALAAEIGQSLLIQTRNLQTRVATLEQENATLRERCMDSSRETRIAKNAAIRGEQNEARAHERVWSLELQKQELQNQLTQLQRSLAKTAVDNNRQTQLLAIATEQVETLKASEEKLNTTIEKIRAKHGQESGAYRRTLAGLATDGMSKEGDIYLSTLKVGKSRGSRMSKMKACDLREQEISVDGNDSATGDPNTSNIAVIESKDTNIRAMRIVGTKTNCSCIDSVPIHRTGSVNTPFSSEGQRRFDIAAAIPSQIQPEQTEDENPIQEVAAELATEIAVIPPPSVLPRRRCATPITTPKFCQRHRMRGTFSGSARRRRKSITPVLAPPRRGLFEELAIASGIPVKPYWRDSSFADTDLASSLLVSATPFAPVPPEDGIESCQLDSSVITPHDKPEFSRFPQSSSMTIGEVISEVSQKIADDPLADTVKLDGSLDRLSTRDNDRESFTGSRKVSLKSNLSTTSNSNLICEKSPFAENSVSQSLNFGSTCGSERLQEERSKVFAEHVESLKERRNINEADSGRAVNNKYHTYFKITQSPQRGCTDPATITAITETMIGELLYKYTRSRIGSGNKISDKRHLRFFWVHPYTRSLYWRRVQQPNCTTEANLPTGPKIAAAMACVAGEQKAKSAYILSLRVVVDGPGSENPSIILRTRDRELKIKACSFDRHEVWFKALSFLVSRQLFSVVEGSSTGDANGAVEEKLCPTIAASTACTVEMTANSKKRHTEAKRKINQDEEAKETGTSLTGSVKRKQHPSSRCLNEVASGLDNQDKASPPPTSKMLIGGRSSVSSCPSNRSVRSNASGDKITRRSSSSAKTRFFSAFLGNSTVSPEVNSTQEKSPFPGTTTPVFTKSRSSSTDGIVSANIMKRLRPANQVHLHRIFETVLAEAKSKGLDE